MVEAGQSARRELEALQQRSQTDRERYAAQQAKVHIFTQQLAQCRQEIAQLEGSQTETVEATAAINDRILSLKTEGAALDAEKATALSHIQDLQGLRAAMEGDKEKKLALMDSMKEDTQRLGGEIEALQLRQQENDAQAADMKQQVEKALTHRSETEASKTLCEREAQEKSKDILNMERACALLEQKKVTSSMEERQIVDKLWDSYGLTPSTAKDSRGEIESIPAGNRRIGELKRKIAALGTPNLGAIEEFARVNKRYY